MNIYGFKCISIEHYDGSVVEAYRLSAGDSYRLQLRNRKGSWTWKFAESRDIAQYESREMALFACISYLFRRMLQLSVAMQYDKISHAQDLCNKLPHEDRLPTRFKSVDSIDLHGKQIDFIDILTSEDKFYAFYSNSCFSGPYPSKNDLMKDLVRRFSEKADDFLTSINKINNILNCLDL